MQQSVICVNLRYWKSVLQIYNASGENCAVCELIFFFYFQVKSAVWNLVVDCQTKGNNSILYQILKSSHQYNLTIGILLSLIKQVIAGLFNFIFFALRKL